MKSLKSLTPASLAAARLLAAHPAGSGDPEVTFSYACRLCGASKPASGVLIANAGGGDIAYVCAEPCDRPASSRPLGPTPAAPEAQTFPNGWSLLALAPTWAEHGDGCEVATCQSERRMKHYTVRNPRGEEGYVTACCASHAAIACGGLY